MISNLKWLTVSILLLGSACTSKKSSNEDKNKVTLESIKLVNLSGEKIDMDQFKDKTVFINFWATWCKPCIQEMPTIQNAQSQLKDKNVVFLLASNEEINQIESFRSRRKFELEFVQVQNLEALNIQALPATFIFNPEGELAFSEVGYRMWDSPENLNLIGKNSNE
jgi:thiol-disulfide isomerase/thioredoxin